MLGYKHFKADAATFVMKMRNGKVAKQGKGLSFLYNSAFSSVVAVPMSIKEAPFIFNLQSADYQALIVQGHITYKVNDPLLLADAFNFTIKAEGNGYVSDDPMNLNDKVIRPLQSLLQRSVQRLPMKQAISKSGELTELAKSKMAQMDELKALGLKVVEVVISDVAPNKETLRALEAEAREAILKEADDAIYLRRKSAVEQERMIKDAELETEKSVQQKEQEIRVKAIENKRDAEAIEADLAQERLGAKIELENQSSEYAARRAENDKVRADAKAYEIKAQLAVADDLDVDKLKALAMAKMGPEMMLAMAIDNLASNADKIGQLNISPDLLASLRSELD